MDEGCFVMSTSFLLCLVLPEVTGGGHELVESLPHLQQGILFLFFVLLLNYYLHLFPMLPVLPVEFFFLC